MTQVLQGFVFLWFFDGFRAPKRVLELKTRFGATIALWDPKIERVVGAV